MPLVEAVAAGDHTWPEPALSAARMNGAENALTAAVAAT